MRSRAAPVFISALSTLIGGVACGARAGLPGGASGEMPTASGGSIGASGGQAGRPGTGGTAGVGGTPIDPCATEPGLPDSGWVMTWGGLGFDRARAVFETPTGILVAGSFNAVTDFDPGPGIDQHSASIRDLYVSDYDADGTYRWTRTMGGAGLGDGIELDGAARGPDGSVFLTTKFIGTLATSGDDLTSSDYGIAVLDVGPDGAVAWGRSWTVRDFYASPAVAVDADGSVFVLGTFSGVTDFDPGSGVDTRDSTAGRTFVEKLDRDGNHVWVSVPFAKTCYGGAISVDADGSPWIATSCTESFGTSLDVAKLDPGGAVLAVALWNVEAAPRALVAARDGSVYLAGRTREGDLGTVNGLEDALLLALDSNGVARWSRTWGGGSFDSNDLDELSSVTVDACGSPIVAGMAANPFDIDPGSVQDIRAAGAYVSKFTADGSLIWAKSWDGPPSGFSYTEAFGVQSPSPGELLLAGTFAGTVDFALRMVSDPRQSAGSEDAFVMRLDP